MVSRKFKTFSIDGKTPCSLSEIREAGDLDEGELLEIQALDVNKEWTNGFSIIERLS